MAKAVAADAEVKPPEPPKVVVLPSAPAATPPETLPPVGLILKCRVHVPGSHVGTIECGIPANTAPADRHAAALISAAAVRGIALNASGLPQFASAPQVEFLES